MDHSDFFENIANQIKAYTANNNIPASEERAFLRRLFDSLVQAWDEGAQPVIQLSAPNSVVEFIDRETGRLFRRWLELEYFENDNGIRLVGEDMSGSETHIAYLSETALKKLHDLRGFGLDSPRCEHE